MKQIDRELYSEEYEEVMFNLRNIELRR